MCSLKKDLSKAIWKDVLKPNSRKTICNIVWIIIHNMQQLRIHKKDKGKAIWMDRWSQIHEV